MSARDSFPMVGSPEAALAWARLEEGSQAELDARQAILAALRDYGGGGSSLWPRHLKAAYEVWLAARAFSLDRLYAGERGAPVLSHSLEIALRKLRLAVREAAPLLAAEREWELMAASLAPAEKGGEADA